MDRRVRLLALGGVVIIALAATLLLAPPEGSLTVDEVMQDPDDFTGDSISVRGVVKNGTWEEGSVEFLLEGEGSDLFIDAEEIQVGCPSKYEAQAESGGEHPDNISQ